MKKYFIFIFKYLLKEEIIDVNPFVDSYAPKDYHFNTTGNLKLANAIYNLLSKEKIIHCN